MATKAPVQTSMFDPPPPEPTERPRSDETPPVRPVAQKPAKLDNSGGGSSETDNKPDYWDESIAFFFSRGR